MVNEKGYLINEVTGAIRSRYTWEDLFIGEFGSLSELGELPMPYRLEKYNFNPHKISGNFDFNDKRKPMFLQNKHKQFTDKDWKPVNKAGYLINERGDVIDKDGQVRFLEH